MTPRREEHGLSIVEVIIAALLLTAVMMSIALAMTSATRSRGVSRLQAALTTSAQEVKESLVADREWMRSCTTIDAWCDVRSSVSPDALQLDEFDGVAQLQLAQVMAVDSDIDGRAPNDADGVTPDYYRIEVELVPAAALAQRYGVDPVKAKRRVVTTIDRRGTELEGSLTVEACRSINQVDERMNIHGCRSGASTNIQMTGCPPDERPGCTPAWSWIAANAPHNTNPSPYVVMQRQSISFTLVNISTGATYPSSSADTPAAGEWRFDNLPTGEYRMTGLPSSAGGGVRWTSKDLPSPHGGGSASVVVEPGTRNRAMVAYRPPEVGGIRFYFDRRTRRYRITGPHTSTEVSVPKWAPTDEYVGAQAAALCSAITFPNLAGAFYNYECVGIEPISQNCVELLVSGNTYEPAAGLTGDYNVYYDTTQAYAGGDVGLVVTESLGTGAYNKVSFSNRRYFKLCSFYWEYYTHTYYRTNPTPTWQTRPGAAKGVTYYMEPKPDWRRVDISGGIATAPIPRCKSIERQTTCESPMTGLVPGLNTDLRVAKGDEEDAEINEEFIHRPAWAVSGAAWVRTNGAITTPAGSVPPNPYIHLRGMGECYWLSPNYTGEREGSCNPCKALWKVDWTAGGCSLLTRTRWCRPAMERVWRYDLGTGALDGGYLEFDLPTICGNITYSPAWYCTTYTPNVRKTAATCDPPPAGGPATKPIPRTTHPSTRSKGAAIVAQSGVGRASV